MREMPERFEFFAWAAEPVFDDHRDVPLLGHARHVFQPAIHRHGADDFSNVAMKRETEARGLDAFGAGEGLAGREFPWFPPEAALRMGLAPASGKGIKQQDQSFIEGNAEATGTGAEFTAEPRILIVGIDEEIINAGKIARESVEQEFVTAGAPFVSEAVGRTVTVPGVGVVGSAKVEHRSQSRLPAKRDTMTQFFPPLFAWGFARFTAQRHDLRILLFLFGCEPDDIFEVERFIIRARSPRDIYLDGVESQFFQPADRLRRPGNRHRHFKIN